MRTRSTYDYAVIRVVPRVEREEFLNVGVILSCPAHDFLDARLHFDRQRLAAFDATLDLDLVEQYLNMIPLVCRGDAAAGPIAQLTQRQRFHWLIAPRSTIIQTSVCTQRPVWRCAGRFTAAPDGDDGAARRAALVADAGVDYREGRVATRATREHSGGGGALHYSRQAGPARPPSPSCSAPGGRWRRASAHAPASPHPSGSAPPSRLRHPLPSAR